MYLLQVFSATSLFTIYMLDIYLIAYFWNLHFIYFAPIYNRIVAYWLMLSVLQTTEINLV